MLSPARDYNTFLSRINEILVDIFELKIEILDKTRNFGQKSKFWTKIEILDNNQNNGEKTKFWAKIEILDNNRNIGQKSKY